ncbi:major facilitator super transporter protein, partial [Ascosphaera pollenicola]
MITNMPLREHKVAILGTYQNTATGAEFVEYFQKHMDATSISFAERIGQDMTDSGYLRLVGQVGSTFANSSRMNYQIRPKAFEVGKIPLPKKPLIRTSTFGSLGSRPSSRTNSISMTSDDSTADSPVNAVTELFSGWNPLNTAHPNETPVERLKREADEADERYKIAVRKLDRMRCALEEEVIEYLKFMERCELDRLKAIKTVILDFSGAIGNVLPSMRSTVDQMMLFQESIQPMGDLRYLLENYRTGAFIPRVTSYENYYGTVEDQTFGVDLEARARADKKRVPVIVTNILTFLDEHYPALEGDEARRMIWLANVPLQATHHLRNAINNGQAVPSETLEKYDIPVVAAVLKLYLLELPDSIISCQLYEIVRSAYSSAEYASEEARVKILQGTLSNLRLNNIATLDVILTHFVRLIDLTSADEAYVTTLTQVLAPCIIRPRQENTISMGEKWSARLLKDLFQHKDEIFGELKRQSHTNSFGTGRPRAPSTDERNRRAAQEARAKAIASRSRAVSPASSIRHRRDRSKGSDGSTRFPINVAGSVGSPTNGRNGTSTVRNSLEVPLSSFSPPPAPVDGHGDEATEYGSENGGSAITASNVSAAINRDKRPT